MAVRRVLALCAVITAAAGGFAGAAQAASGWTPEPATYGTGTLIDQPVPMSDGTILRANVCYPTNATTGAPAPGPFPVLLTQTPYGKGSSCGDSYLVQRGYIYVASDARGTGDSGGTFGLFQPREADDGAELVKWAASLPHARPQVGLTGCSYLGIDQVMTAEKPAAYPELKAILPECVNPYIYELQYQGGLNDNEWNTVYWGLTGGDSLANPVEDQQSNPDPTGFALTETDHAAGTVDFQGKQTAEEQLGGPDDANDVFWQARDYTKGLSVLVRHHVPALMTGGWEDLVGQHGAPWMYAQLQNLWAGRPQYAPMKPDQPVTGRYQLMMGEWYHGGATANMETVRLEWFDTWLKGERTGLGDTTTPLHAYENGPNHWIDTTTYPFAPAKPTRLYLGPGTTGSASASLNDGALTPAAPRGASGQDQIAYTNATSPCNIGPGVWTAGIAKTPCATNDQTLEAGPSALTYSTPPLTQPEVIAGPIEATIYATSTTPDTELVATLEDVSGTTPVPYATGALLGSYRALDPARTWYAADGTPLDPMHPFTAESAKAVTTGQVTRYDIELWPTLVKIPAGDRIRLTLTTSDVPHLQPNAQQIQNLLGGVYQVQRNAAGPSWLELPLAPAGAFPKLCGALCS
jgi:putative CocE/NonD family hydrolase